MNAEVSRRMFVGSVAAGLPLLAGSAAGAIQSGGTAAHAHTGDGGVDPLLDHIAGEIGRICKRTQDRGISAEDARAMAAHFRTMSVYARHINLDSPTKQAARRLLDARGREGALYVEIDKGAARRELKRYGVDADERWFDTSAVDYATRVRSRDEFLTTGVTGVLARAIVTFDALADELDRRGPQTARIVRVQTWETGFCQQITREMIRLQMDASFVCAFGAYYGALLSVCAMIEAAIGVQAAAYLYYC